MELRLLDIEETPAPDLAHSTARLARRCQHVAVDGRLTPRLPVLPDAGLRDAVVLLQALHGRRPRSGAITLLAGYDPQTGEAVLEDCRSARDAARQIAAGRAGWWVVRLTYGARMLTLDELPAPSRDVIRRGSRRSSPNSTRWDSRAGRRARSATRTTRSVSTAPALRQTRSSYRTAPLRSHRILRLRQGHAVLALVWFSAHELSREASLQRALTAVLWTIVWYASIRWTLLRESRAAPSWAFTVVRAAREHCSRARVILAGNAILGTGDSIGSELAAIAAMGMIAFLWQAAVAGHHSLGEPLRCVIVGPAETVRMMETERVAPGARAFELVGWIDDRAEPGARESTRAPVPRDARRPGARRLRRRLSTCS